jgi:zinc protease
MRTCLALMCLSLSLGAAHAAEPAFPRPDIKEWQLDNGLGVIYLGVHKAPIVTVQVWVHVGSKDEARDRRGSAHMFEHMMFRGTARVPPEQHARWIDGLGGSVNAFTREDMTGYHQTLPRQYLDFAVQLEADRMRNLLIRKEMVDTEREVVKEELRSRIESSPIAKAFERFRAIAYTRHPYAWLPIGTKEDLDQLTVAELRRFYDAYYRPNNATLVVVGDVTEDQVRASVERWFGGLERGPAPPRPAAAAAEPPQTAPRREVVGPAQLGVVIGGYHMPAARSPDLHALQVLLGILSGGESSRLFRRVVRGDRSGVFAGGQLMVLEDPGMLIVFGVHLAPEQGARVEQALLEEVDRLAREPVRDEELVKAKNQITARFVFGLEGVEGLAAQLGSSKVLVGDARAWVDDYDRILAVTAADVMRVARAYLRRENLTLVVIPPAGGGQ